jgi:hypothetical protein
MRSDGRSLREKTIALDILQISDVLAQKCVPSFRQADGVFEFTSNREHRGVFPSLIVFQKNRHRNKTARTSQLPRHAARHAHHGIVAAQKNLAVVHQEAVSQPTQAIGSFPIINGDRLLAQVAAGHHQGLEFALGKQKVMQRRIRQKNSQVAIEGGNGSSEILLGFPISSAVKQ